MTAGTLNTTTTQTLQTTRSLLQQVGTQLQNSVYNQQYNLGNFVTNISILPFLPSTTIQFDAFGLKPNTRLYAYFGNVPVSSYCAPRLNGYNLDSVDGSQLTNALGTPLFSDAQGRCRGIFRIPANTFKSQEITFRLTDINDLSQGESAVTTEADGTFYGSTLSVAKGQSLLNTRQTVVSSVEVTQQKVVEGLAVATQVTQNFVPDPPPQYHGGSDCPCGCFTDDTEVLLENGLQVKISEVKVGDRVYNYNKTAINEVKFVEIADSSYFNGLYSPNKKIKPFATTNHPLYIDGKLSSLDPKNTKKWYPWLGETNPINALKHPIEVEKVYNLWVDGDGTYIVNGFGTTSIIGDGGLLRLGIEQKIITMEEATKMIMYYTEKSTNISYGAYILNDIFGKKVGSFNIKWLNRFILVSLSKEHWFRNIANFVFNLTGKISLNR